MRIYVINLDRREDRLAFMSEQLAGHAWERWPALDGRDLTLERAEALGFAPAAGWTDPLLGRPLTMGEIAAAVSHFGLWEKCAADGENILILEDDSRLVGELRLEEVDGLLGEYELVYLDHREMVADRAKVASDLLVEPYYPYWANAYAIGPRLAEQLVDSPFRTNVIPVDELLAMVNGVDYDRDCLTANREIVDLFNSLRRLYDEFAPIRSVAYREPIFRQVPREVLGSDVEPGPTAPRERRVHVLTVATDESRMSSLRDSAAKHGVELVNLGRGVAWQGGDMAGPGGGHKVNLVRDYVAELEEDETVLFVDGYDTAFTDTAESVAARFEEAGCKVLFAAEKTCWPDPSLAERFDGPTDYRYLNSGAYIGSAGAIRRLIGGGIADSDDDQLFLQKRFLEHKDAGALRLDTGTRVFQCLSGALDDVGLEAGRLVNRATGGQPCILHANGGPAVKEELAALVAGLSRPPEPRLKFSKPVSLVEVAPEILETVFLSREMCDTLIAMAEAHASWQAMPGDKFPAQELRVRELDIALFDQLEAHMRENVYPLLERHWWPLKMHGLRDAFVIRYSPTTQVSLDCHTDASLVSGNVKLNDEYEGGETFFYRQDFSNEDTRVGNILFWPGQVTHGHEGRPVTAGTKYNLVIWTSRRPGDVNY